MEQCNDKVVFKHRKGYKHEVFYTESGDLIVETVPVEEYDKAEYFAKVSEEDRKKVAEWFHEQEKGDAYSCKKQFLHYVEEAIEKINYDYWIATLEPSIVDGKIYYKEGETVGVGLECIDWKQKAIEYYPERKSRMAKIMELAMWYALRIVENHWTLEYVVECSSGAGNYQSSRFMERTGARVCGGYKDGQGNSYRIVILDDYSFALVGGDFWDDCRQRPVAYLVSGYEPPEAKKWGAGVVVLTK